jgi:hypothetical protein
MLKRAARSEKIRNLKTMGLKFQNNYIIKSLNLSHYSRRRVKISVRRGTAVGALYRPTGQIAAV